MGSGPGDHGGRDQSVAASHGHSGCGPHHEAKRQAWIVLPETFEENTALSTP